MSSDSDIDASFARHPDSYLVDSQRPPTARILPGRDRRSSKLNSCKRCYGVGDRYQAQIGKLNFNGSVEEAIQRHRFSALSIAVRHAEGAGALPMLHTDPFDRLLVAQAQLESLVLATVDELVLQ